MSDKIIYIVSTLYGPPVMFTPCFDTALMFCDKNPGKMFWYSVQISS